MAKSRTKPAQEVEEKVVDTPKEQPKTIDALMAACTKDYGAGSLIKLGSSPMSKIEVISTGVPGLDIALGVMGLPRGRVIEIFGPPSGGKTTLALSIAAQCQQAGGVVAIIDAEHALDGEYAGKIGVNIEEMLYNQPDYGEQALDMIEKIVLSNLCDVIIVDSVAALVPKVELDGDNEDNQPGLQARMLSKGLRKLTGIIGKTRTIVIFINQLRQKIGVMFGNPEVTTGGQALPFYASVRIDVRKIETLKKNGEEYGNRVKAKIVKNKVAPPFKVSEFNIIFGKGPDSNRSLLDVAVEFDIVKKDGSWFSFNDTRLGQGADNAALFVGENPQISLALESEVQKFLKAKYA